MVVAEDIAAFATVVSPCPVVEVAHARGLVANHGFGIRLFGEIVLAYRKWS